MENSKNNSDPCAIIRGFYQEITDAESNCDYHHKNVPLKIAGHLEKHFRKIFLDHEEAAAEADTFFRDYANKNRHILTRMCN